MSDAVLAQRVGSVLGSVTKRLDVPRVHVTVQDGAVTLHGSVGRPRDVWSIEESVLRVPGVTGMNSYLHVGLGPGLTRPSAGRRREPSAARRDLLGSVRALDVGDEEEVERLTRAVLANVFELLPEGERAHVSRHLPNDVLDLVEAPLRIGRIERPRTADELVQAVRDSCDRSPGTAELAIRAVIGTLRDLVPEEVTDVEAVLPEGLEALWLGAD